MKNIKKKSFLLHSNIKQLKQYKNITSEQLAKAIKINYETLKNYEKNLAEPSIKNLFNLSEYFQISIDFLLLWNNCNYIRNIKLFSLAEKIDKMAEETQQQIESTVISLIGEHRLSRLDIRFDVVDLVLTDNIHENIKILFEKNKEITSKQVAEELNVDTSMISSYRTRTKPPRGKLIKLSEIFEISIHALITGEKLNYCFKNDTLKENLLRADKFLSLEQHKFLIQLMEAIIKNN